MVEDELRYDILRVAPYKEEFFVLVSLINYHCQEELDLLLKVLSDLVNEGFLCCEKGDKEIKRLTCEQLQLYVEQRIQAGEPLDEYAVVSEEYIFQATDKGLAYVDAIYDETKQAATGIINALGQYKSDYSLYPSKLCELCPKYLQKIEPPAKYHGNWLYLPFENLTKCLLLFGAYRDYSVMHYFNFQIGKWDFDFRK